MNKHIVISKGAELLRIPADCLMYVAADGNYSNVITSDGHSKLVTYQLGQIQDAINNQIDENESKFMRLGRGLIINRDYVYFVDIAKQELILSDFHGNYYNLSASKEVLTKLKLYIESFEND